MSTVTAKAGDDGGKTPPSSPMLGWSITQDGVATRGTLLGDTVAFDI
jgi:hypothetical protein